MKSSQCFIIVFALDDKFSFEMIDSFMNDIKFCKPNKYVLFICGNKMDIDDRKITRYEALKFCCNNKIVYTEISTKSNENVQNYFDTIIINLPGLISTNIL